MKISQFALMALAVASLTACNKKDPMKNSNAMVDSLKQIQFETEQFADIQVLKYDIPGWEKLTLKEKKLVYYLAQAGYSGRDIFWDQNYKNNLKIRTALENVYKNYKGDKNEANWKKFEIYLKRIWFSNGIHHHYSNSKIKPDFPHTYLQKIIKKTKTNLGASIC